MTNYHADTKCWQVHVSMEKQVIFKLLYLIYWKHASSWERERQCQSRSHPHVRWLMFLMPGPKNNASILNIHGLDILGDLLNTSSASRTNLNIFQRLVTSRNQSSHLGLAIPLCLEIIWSQAARHIKQHRRETQSCRSWICNQISGDVLNYHIITCQIQAHWKEIQTTHSPTSTCKVEKQIKLIGCRREHPIDNVVISHWQFLQVQVCLSLAVDSAPV